MVPPYRFRAPALFLISTPTSSLPGPLSLPVPWQSVMVSLPPSTQILAALPDAIDTVYPFRHRVTFSLMTGRSLSVTFPDR